MWSLAQGGAPGCIQTRGKRDGAGQGACACSGSGGGERPTLGSQNRTPGVSLCFCSLFVGTGIFTPVERTDLHGLLPGSPGGTSPHLSLCSGACSPLVPEAQHEPSATQPPSSYLPNE